MKVLHLFGSYSEEGGLEKNVMDLAAGQAEEGWDVCAGVSGRFLEAFAEEVEVREVNWRLSRRDPRLSRSIKRLVRELQPDVIHCHANKPSEIVGRIGNSLSAVVVATVHNIKKRISVFEKMDAVIAPSQLVADSLGGIPAKVVWNAVAPFDEIWRERAKALRPPGLEGATPIFLAAGRFVRAKGYDLLIDAFSQIEQVQLWLVGDGPDREALAALVRTKGLSRRVWMPGFLTPEEVRGLMGLADCFVISSRNEGGPYTLAEALRARCAVLSTRVGYTPEFLQSEQLCDEVSVGALIRGIKRFCENESAYKEGMRDIFELAEQELDTKKMVRKVNGVYRGLL